MTMDCETRDGWDGPCRVVGRPSLHLWCKPCLITEVAVLKRRKDEDIMLLANLQEQLEELDKR